MMKPILAIAVLISLTSCGKADKRSGILSDSFRLTDADFKPTLPLRDFSESDVVEELANTMIFSPLQSQDRDDDEQSRCYDEKLKAWPIKASGEHIELYTNVDSSSCHDNSGSGVSTATIVERSFLSASCAGADFSYMNGKHSVEIDLLKEISIKCGTSDVYMLTFAESTYEFTSESTSGSGFKFESKGKTVYANFSGDMKPCKTSRQDDVATESGCQTVLRTVTEKSLLDGAPYSAAHGKEVIVKTTSRDVKSSISNPGPWFDSGSFGIELNGWTGDISYSSHDQAPTFKLKNGAKEVSGTLAP